MKITDHLFEAFLKCPTKCWLRATNEIPTGNTYAEWVKAQNEFYRVAETSRLLAQIPPTDSALSPPADNLKGAKWRLAVDITVTVPDLLRSCRWQEAHSSVAQTATLNSQPSGQSRVTSADNDQADVAPTAFTAETCIHAAERVPSESRGKAAQFIPIRFIFTNKMGKDNRLLLAFDAFVLSAALGREIVVGKIVHGDNHAALKVKASTLAGEVRKRLAKIAALLSSPVPPDLVLNRHCSECEFQAHCRQQALEKDDISLLAGMNEKLLQKYRRKGIFTIRQLSYVYRPRRRRKRPGQPPLKFNIEIQALAIRTGKIYIDALPSIASCPVRIFLDIEGIPEQKFDYLIGVLIETSEGVTERSLWADSPAHEEEIFRQCIALLGEFKDAPVYHYGSYEPRAFARVGLKYGLDIGALERRLVNVNTFIFGRVYFPTRSNRLKDLGRFIGASWQTPTATGLDSLAWRYRWEDTNDGKWKDLLHDYNRDDCRALGLLTAELRGLAETAGSQENVDFADSPKQRCTDSGAEIHDDFKRILLSAHHVYKRSRIKVRQKGAKETRAKDAPKRINPIVARRIPVKGAKIVRVRRKRNCPRHRTHRLKAVDELAEHSLIDLAFTASGCRKIVTRYIGPRGSCPLCGVTYIPPAISRMQGRIFADGFMAFVAYQRVALRLSYGAISKLLEDLFGETVNQSTLVLLLDRMADQYADTERLLTEEILRNSPFVHVDETSMGIRATTQYIWVLTDGKHVVFRLTPTREATMIKEMLADYSGVLITDFYGGYDAVACRQQKCLVHLIRDLNDDLWKNPFNQEFESFVGSVRTLLVPILKDVENFGLRKRHLHKHQKAVQRFYRLEIHALRSSSELVTKYLKRFVRYRDSLFTFLDNDGVSWNNNEAERAIRHLAIQRKISGFFSGPGCEKYLVLLGIAQTCRFQGKSFLKFLLSGEKNVDNYRERKTRKR